MWLLGDRFFIEALHHHDYDRGFVGFSDAIRTPESAPAPLARVCFAFAGFVLLLVVIGVARRRKRQRSAVHMSIAIHW